MATKARDCGPAELVSIVREELLEVERRSGMARGPFAQEVLASRQPAIIASVMKQRTPRLVVSRESSQKNLGVSVLALVGAALLSDDLGNRLGEGPFCAKNRPRTKRVGVLDCPSKDEAAGGAHAAAHSDKNLVRSRTSPMVATPQRADGREGFARSARWRLGAICGHWPRREHACKRPLEKPSSPKLMSVSRSKLFLAINAAKRLWLEKSAGSTPVAPGQAAFASISPKARISSLSSGSTTCSAAVVKGNHCVTRWCISCQILRWRLTRIGKTSTLHKSTAPFLKTLPIMKRAELFLLYFPEETSLF